MNILKNRVLPVVVGLLAGWVVIFVLEAVSHLFYPPPANIDYADKAAMAAFMQSLPSAAFLLLLLAWMIGAFIGGLTGAFINKKAARNSSIIIGVVLALGSIINMTLIPHPTWLMVTASIGYVPMAYFGGKLISNNKQRI